MNVKNQGVDTDIQYYEARFYTAVNNQNFGFILSQVKENFLARFGRYVQ